MRHVSAFAAEIILLFTFQARSLAVLPFLCKYELCIFILCLLYLSPCEIILCRHGVFSFRAIYLLTQFVSISESSNLANLHFPHFKFMHSLYTPNILNSKQSNFLSRFFLLFLCVHYLQHVTHSCLQMLAAQFIPQIQSVLVSKLENQIIITGQWLCSLTN